MKINIFVQKLEQMLKCNIQLRWTSKRVWTIGGWGAKYIDPDYIVVDSLFPLTEHLERCSAVTEKGVINGPESTTFKNYYKIKGFYILPWHLEGQKGDIFTASKLRNSRYQITERTKL